jgi:uncharacterized protein (TIGR02996 family)
MAEDEGLLQEIVAYPEDDTPRLVYADWLEDHDQPERAEFIRLQIEVARIELADSHGPRTSCLLFEGRSPHAHLRLSGVAPGWHLRNNPQADQLRNRAWELLRKHGLEWGAAFRNRAREHCWRRGLVEEVTATARKLLTHAATWFRLAPIRTLTLSRTGDLLARVAALPELGRLAELHLWRNDLGDREAAVLAASPHLAGLKVLELRYNQIGPAGAAALAGSPHLGQLVSLDLYANPVGPDGVTVLRQRFGEALKR